MVRRVEFWPIGELKIVVVVVAVVVVIVCLVDLHNCFATCQCFYALAPIAAISLFHIPQPLPLIDAFVSLASKIVSLIAKPT